MTTRARIARLVSLLALTLLPAAPALAAWPNDPTVNVPMSDADGAQVSCEIASDGAGGAFVTWLDGQGVPSIRVQRVSALGVPMWTSNGVSVCSTADSDSRPNVLGDGLGGVIVVWTDTRNGWDLYAQRLSGAGVALWTAGGVALAPYAGGQSFPMLDSDGSGGAIVAWTDTRSDYGDIYAQRISAGGVLQWTAGGVPVCALPNPQYSPRVLADGLGGAFISWQDYRGGDGTADTYVQRVSAAGAAQWTADGVAVCTAPNTQWVPDIVTDGAGGIIVAWTDARDGTGKVYAQRVGPDGTPLWTADGVRVCSASSGQAHDHLVADGTGGAIVPWKDYRSGVSGVYAQRLNAAGTPVWAGDGVPLRVGGVDDYAILAMAPDLAGGAIVAWLDGRSFTSSDVYAQRVSAAGSVLWATNGVPVCTRGTYQHYPVMCTDGAGGAILAYWDFPNTFTNSYDILAQRVDRWGCLGAQPTITGVSDVPGDEGGWVTVGFTRSPEDGAGNSYVNEYWLWRQIPQSAAAAALARGARFVAARDDGGSDPGRVVRTSVAGGQTWYWEYVGTLPAGPPAYWVNFTTRCDSLAGSNPRTLFMIEARNTAGTMWWFSDPDSGYSVDNLAPPAPTPFTGSYANGTTTLGWGASAAADFSVFRLYRGSQSSFTPGPSNLVRTQTTTGYTDVAGAPYWYKLTAVDIHGNEGPPTTLQPDGTADAPGTSLPRELALSAPAPNPLRGSCTMRLALPRAADVSLAVFDQQGRRVRTLLAGTAPAGERAVAWDGRDDAGRRVADGIYFARLACEGRTIARRIAALR